MTKTGVIRCLLSVVLIVYLVMALLISNDMAARDMCRGFQIEVMQNGASRNFVSKSEVERLLAEWHLDNTDLPASRVPVHTIETKLNAIDNIEHAVVERTAANKIRISVTPMIPVARIFDNMGHSYYINHQQRLCMERAGGADHGRAAASRRDSCPHDTRTRNQPRRHLRH